MKIRKPRLYLAGPLFSEAERELNVNLKSLLSSYFKVYLPQEDGALLVDLIKRFPVNVAKRRIHRSDIRAVRKCDVFFIVLDGRSVDEGAALELGIAYILKKPCYGLQTDPRRLLPVGNNPMIDGSLRKTFLNKQELLRWAKRYGK